MFAMRRTFLLALLIMLLPLTARAEMSIAVVDVRFLLTESEAAKSIQKQKKEKREEFLETLLKQEKILRENERQLVESREDLSPEDFAQKRQAFEAELVESRRIAQQQKKAFEEAAESAANTLRDALYQVVGEIAAEKGYNLVISRENVIVAEKVIDISEEAMNRLNKSFSEITLNITDK